MLSKPTFLVIGGDGLIGNALARRLKQENYDVIVTSRQTRQIDGATLRFDLAGNLEDLLDDPSVRDHIRCGPTITVLTAAITGFVQCSQDETRSRLVNVSRTVDLARRLLIAGSSVVFISSNAVFSGRIADPTDTTEPDPSTTYGRQKAETERGLLDFHAKMKHPPRLMIVRLTKVISRKLSLIDEWINRLRRGETIAAFHDRRISPISLEYTVSGLARIAEFGESGIYHLTGESDISYFAFATTIAKTLGVSTDLVKSTGASDTAGLAQESSKLGNTAAGMGLCLRPEKLNSAIENLLIQ